MDLVLLQGGAGRRTLPHLANVGFSCNYIFPDVVSQAKDDLCLKHFLALAANLTGCLEKCTQMISECLQCKITDYTDSPGI